MRSKLFPLSRQVRGAMFSNNSKKPGDIFHAFVLLLSWRWERIFLRYFFMHVLIYPSISFYSTYTCIAFRVLAAGRCTNIPDNVQGWYVQEMEDSQKSQSTVDR